MSPWKVKQACAIFWPISSVGCNWATGFCTDQWRIISHSSELPTPPPNIASIISVPMLILTHPYLPNPSSYLPVLSKVASLSIKKPASRTFLDINPCVPQADLAAPIWTILPGLKGPKTLMPTRQSAESFKSLTRHKTEVSRLARPESVLWQRAEANQT